MIEGQEPTKGKVVKQETPTRITTTMILEDLENGIDRNGIQEKYNLEAWEVKQMFIHPALKGKKAKKVRKLSFEFVDDTVDPNQTSIPTENGDNGYDPETMQITAKVKGIDFEEGTSVTEEEVFTDLDEQSEEMEREMHYKSPSQVQGDLIANEFEDGQEEDTDIEY
jgi:hypothetical protein